MLGEIISATNNEMCDLNLIKAQGRHSVADSQFIKSPKSGMNWGFR